MAGLNWLMSMLQKATGGGPNGDQRMTLERALTYAPVWNAVSKISNNLAGLPLNLHLQQGRDNTKPTDHVGYRTMRVRPNAYQTPFVWKQQVMVHALLLGNGRSFIHRQGLNTELVPIMSDRCESALVDGEKYHFYKPERDERLSVWDDIGTEIDRAKARGVPPEVLVLPDSEVHHVPGLSLDGVQGKSLIKVAAQSFNIGLGAETQERSKQRKGYSGGVMLEAPEGVFTKQQDAEEFLEYFRRSHDGEENAGKTGLLRQGIRANVMAMSNTDAQFIEQRMFQRQETALFFLLEQILGDDSSVSYNSLEQKNLAYLQNCLGSWLTKWEEETKAKLLTPREVDQGYYFKFNDGALLRTDKQTTAQVASTLISARVLNPNQAREWFDMNPYDGGDEYANPSVTPGAPGSDEPAESDPAPEPPAENTAARARLTHLVGVESKQMLQACKSENFVDKIERLCKKWEKTYAGDVGEDLAAAHCEDSRAAMLACWDESEGKEQLAAKVAETVAAWPNRIDDLLEEMELTNVS